MLKQAQEMRKISRKQGLLELERDKVEITKYINCFMVMTPYEFKLFNKEL